MPLKTLVKVGHITNLSDARYCAGMGVDMLGFNVVEGQDRYITPKQFQEIRGWITGPLVVAQIYGLTSADALPAILEQYRPDLLELGEEELARLESLPLPFILNIEAQQTDQPFSTKPAYIQILPGNSVSEASIPVIVTISSLNQLENVLNTEGVGGIALHGGQELRPGLKTYDELADILEALETD